MLIQFRISGEKTENLNPGPSTLLTVLPILISLRIDSIFHCYVKLLYTFKSTFMKVELFNRHLDIPEWCSGKMLSLEI